MPALFGAAAANASGWTPEGAARQAKVGECLKQSNRNDPRIFTNYGRTARLAWRVKQDAREAFILSMLRGLQRLVASQTRGAEWAFGEEAALAHGASTAAATAKRRQDN